MPTIREAVGRHQANKIKKAIALGSETELKRMYVPVTMKKMADDGRLMFSGFANVAVIDRQRHIITAATWRKAIPRSLETGLLGQRHRADHEG